MYELVALAELEEWERVWRVYRDADPMRTRLQAAELLADAGDARLFEPLAAQIDELIDRSDAALARASVSEEKHTLLQRWENAEGEWLRRAIAALLTLNQDRALDHLRPRLLRVEGVQLRQLLERALPTAQYADR